MIRHVMTVAALAAALAANVIWNRVTAISRDAAPATDWLVVQAINVADGVAGNDALHVIYDRIIKSPFVGEWFADVKRADDQSNACLGSGKSLYEPKDTLPDVGVTLDWFMGKPCKLPAGQYYIEVVYKITPPGYPEKTYRATSNVFTLR